MESVNNGFNKKIMIKGYIILTIEIYRFKIISNRNISIDQSL